jgi:hypothetical protein
MKIIIKSVGMWYQAELRGEDGNLFGSGESQFEALGSLILQNPKLFNIEVEIIKEPQNVVPALPK